MKLIHGLKALAVGAVMSLPFYSAAYAVDVNCAFPTADTSQCEWHAGRQYASPSAPVAAPKQHSHGAHERNGVIVDYVDNVGTPQYTPFKACTDFNGTTISSFGSCVGIDGTKFPSKERQRPMTNSHVIGAKGKIFMGDGTIQDWLDSAND